MMAGLSPYHFEEAMRFGNHLFDKPQESVKTAEEIRHESRQSVAEEIAAREARLRAALQAAAATEATYPR